MAISPTTIILNRHSRLLTNSRGSLVTCENKVPILYVNGKVGFQESFLGLFCLSTTAGEKPKDAKHIKIIKADRHLQKNYGPRHNPPKRELLIVLIDSQNLIKYFSKMNNLTKNTAKFQKCSEF